MNEILCNKKFPFNRSHLTNVEKLEDLSYKSVAIKKSINHLYRNSLTTKVHSVKIDAKFPGSTFSPFSCYF